MELRQIEWARSPALGLVACLLSGCVGLEHFLDKPEKPPTGKVCQVVATWNRHVAFAPDPANGGVLTPGIVGRLYLFGPQIDFPLAAEGCLTVDLFDDRPRAEGAPPVLLEEWRLDKDTLANLLRKDTIGWGYTLFLPWGTYKPDLTRVRLKLRYDPVGGTPLYTESGPLTLMKPNGI